jgi:glutathione S-transferase
LVVGLSNELLGEWGLGWCKRLQFAGPISTQSSGWDKLLKTEYGLSGDDVPSQAEQRIVAILKMLTQRLRDQKSSKSPYLVGNKLSAADVYWATISNLVRPLPPAKCPLSDHLREIFGNPGAAVDAAIDPILIEHRDYIYNTYLELPVDLS